MELWLIPTILQLITLGIILWGVRQYFRALGMVYIVQRKMDAYIDELLGNTDVPSDNTELCKQDSSVDISVVQKHRERLAALAAGGQAKQYGLVVRGKVVAADQIDVLDDDEVEKLYARYEARLGAAMTRTLGQAALQIYSKLASSFLPIPSQSDLVHDLEVDPFVGHALSSVTCELYHRYGMFLAPLTIALSTAKHCQFGEVLHSDITKDDGGSGDEAKKS